MPGPLPGWGAYRAITEICVVRLVRRVVFAEEQCVRICTVERFWVVLDTHAGLSDLARLNVNFE